MTRQKSERRVVPDAGRKARGTGGPRDNGTDRGGKAAPVEERTQQLRMSFETAEDPKARAKGADVEVGASRRAPATHAAPKSKSKNQMAASATMVSVCEQLLAAFANVASNHGAPGPDRRTVGEMREHLEEWLPALEAALLAGTYEPGNIRRVWIPKASGGERGLGIPNVIDRVVQEAVRLVLEPIYEPTFHAASHGFRPRRSCHTAIAEAKGHLEDGKEWVVDLDLEKFFDRVNHQRLMSKLAQRIADGALLHLINRMLKAKVVLPEGIVVRTDEGVPQGGPLSPLLSNIVLDELDQELERRGLTFVRYADDCNVYVGSERAGKRVMASVVRFIEGRMRLTVNRAKSAVAMPEERHFLGFRLRRDPLSGEVEVLLSKRSEERLDARIRELTPRNAGRTLTAVIGDLNVFLGGWLGFFGVCTSGIERTLQYRDAHIRRRLRALLLQQWKRKRTMVRKLIGLGVKPNTAWRTVYEGHKSLWKASHTPAVDYGLRSAYFAARGLLSLKEKWKASGQAMDAPVQRELDFGIPSRSRTGRSRRSKAAAPKSRM